MSCCNNNLVCVLLFNEMEQYFRNFTDYTKNIFQRSTSCWRRHPTTGNESNAAAATANDSAEHSTTQNKDDSFRWFWLVPSNARLDEYLLIKMEYFRITLTASVGTMLALVLIVYGAVGTAHDNRSANVSSWT